MKVQRRCFRRVLFNPKTLLGVLLIVFIVTSWQYLQHVEFSTSLVPTNSLIDNPRHGPILSLDSTLSRMDETEDIPHVDLCHTCKSCIIPQFHKTRNRHLLSHHRANFEYLQGIRLGQVFDKTEYPDCPICWGCLHNITRLPQWRTAFGLEEGFEVIRGETSAHIYQIQDPLIHGDDLFVVKLWGLDSDDSTLSKHKQKKITKSLQLSLGIQRLVDECDFRDVVSNVWLAPVNGVVPQYGVHVNWDGLWSEYAKGVSISSFDDDALDAGIDISLFQNLLNRKLNSTQIIKAAVLDLLTCQGDRHSQNVFLDEDGQITLIDNDEAFGQGWREVGVDSIFLPSTQFHTALHVGQTYLRKKTRRPRDQPRPSVVLDYRCHVEGGVIGFDFPGEAKQTIKRIANMSVDHVMEHYYLPNPETGSMLIQRARDLLEFGFEWTLENGEPRNPDPLKYPWHPPCCEIGVNPKSLEIECLDPKYKRNFFRPKGDALYGEQ